MLNDRLRHMGTGEIINQSSLEIVAPLLGIVFLIEVVAVASRT